ncbi:MAG: hypothetical protein IPP71_10405 [Bacteroidetes bacterium]|nr:hypothetical protein [Bacteroidota bacterium]
MPVQINEVIIRAVVDPSPGSNTTNQTACPPSGNCGEAELVEKVLEIIREKHER